MPEQITFVYGEEHFLPHRYQGFKAGPISVTTELRPNETYEQAYERVWPQLMKLGDKMFLAKRNAYAEHFLAKE